MNLAHGNYAEFTAFGAYCGEFIDHLTKSNIDIWDISGSNDIYTARVAPSEYMSVARKARDFRVKTAVVKRGGAYFVLRRYRRRIGIPLGILAFFAVIVVMQSFIWDIKIVGNQTLTRAQIVEQLEKNGVKAGTPVKGFNANKVEIEMSLALSELAWVSIERSGSRLIVKISERLDSGAGASQVPSESPCNVIAGRSGRIVTTEIYSGRLLYKPKSGVNKGDIVVSGVVGNGAGGLLFVHADAKIIAECTETVEIYQPYDNYEEIKNGITASDKYVIFLGMNIPVAGDRPIRGDNIKYTEEIRAPKLFGFPLPYRELTQNYVYYDRVRVTDAPTDALEKLNNAIDLYERNFLADAEIISRTVEYFPDDNGIKAVVTHMFYADIAVQKEFTAG